MIAFTHDPLRARFPFGRKTQLRRRYDWDAQMYFNRVQAAGTELSVEERSNISAFIRGLKALGGWESLVDAWTLRSTQNVGTGSTCLGLKGVNGTLLNGITWGVNGMGTVNTGEVRTAPLINPTDSTVWSLFACYNNALAANTVAFSVDDTVATSFFALQGNWFQSAKAGFALANSFGPWVSTGLFSAPVYAAGGFKTNQFLLTPGGVPAVGRWNGNVSFAETLGDSTFPLINSPGLRVRMACADASGHVGTFFAIWKSAVPNLHTLFRDTIGKGLNLP